MFFEASEVFDPVHGAQVLVERCAAYTTLLSLLHQLQAPVTMRNVELLLDNQRELLVFVVQNDHLIATAQGSLLFPGSVPTVLLSNVVVAKSYRGHGYGKLIIRELVCTAERRWAHYRPLSFQLTSRKERGTKPFYEDLGFQPRPTIRYSLSH